MTLIAAAIWVRDAGEAEDALGRAEKATQAGARLIEWRVDALGEKPAAIDSIKRLVRASPAPCIVTCRPSWEGGEFDGADQQRSQLLESLVKADPPPRYIDLELATLERDEQLRGDLTEAVQEGARHRDVHTTLILSVHDFEHRPPDLLQKIERMTDEPMCTVVKVAWQARSLRDNLEVFDLLAERRKPTIALCMGPFGLLSRVLAPKFGGMLTYAADHPQAATAPGQPTIDTLVNRYRFGRINPQTKVYGVIGWPVEQSLGPVIHNAGFDAVGHDGVYLPLPVPPEWEHFKATVGAMVDHDRLDFCGASVTSPHKAHLLRFVGERGGTIDPAAAEIGAANTLIVSEDGALECVNTDAPAVLDALCAAMRGEPAALSGKRIAVFGAGGVARAAVWSLSRCGAKVIIFNRTAAHAAALADVFHGRPTASGQAAHVVVGKPDSLTCGCFDVFINCTSLGMAGGPGEDQTPLPADAPLDDRVTVFDTVYTPRRTPLLARAETAGARTVSGMDMFLRQAAIQFERWTGQHAPTDTFERSIGDA